MLPPGLFRPEEKSISMPGGRGVAFAGTTKATLKMISVTHTAYLNIGKLPSLHRNITQRDRVVCTTILPTPASVHFVCQMACGKQVIMRRFHPLLSLVYVLQQTEALSTGHPMCSTLHIMGRSFSHCR